MRFLIPALVAVLSTDLTARSDETNRGISILQLAKTAMGGDAWNKIEIWHERGTARLPDGTNNSYDSYYDFIGHRFHDLKLADGTKKLTIFDGNGFCFFTDSKLDRKDMSPEMKKVGLQGAYMNTYGFFFPNRFPATVRFTGVKREGSSTFDVVEVIPVGLSSIDIWTNEKTRLIDRYVAGSDTTRLKDYYRVSGLMAPFLGESSGATTVTRSIELLPENPELFKTKQH
jgi:hypothetical protein